MSNKFISKNAPFLLIIRGGEIYINNDIPIRDKMGNGGPTSGGWGPIRGSVPYTLLNQTLEFTVPWNLLGTSDGLFSYGLLLTEWGRTSDLKVGRLFKVMLSQNPPPLSYSASDCLACSGSSESEEKHRSCFFVLFLLDEQLFERKENGQKTGKF